ncbi:MAG: M3 family metallopeptidase, partial [Dokdonella sp.]
MSNPLLESTALPLFSEIRAEHVEPAIDAILAEYQIGIDTLLASKAPRTFGNVIGVCEQLDDRLSRAWAPVGHLHGVMDSEPLREAYTAAQDKIVEFSSALGQNRELYAAVKAVSESAEFASMPRAARTVVEHELRDFVLAGVALEEPARSRYREISSELAKLSTEFEEAVLDATDAWSEHLIDEASLIGIPESGRAVLRAYAEEKGLEGWLVTLKQPSVQAVLTYADDRELRARVYRAYGTRASENSDAGKYDNSARIERILALRHESAQLLGFANTAEESLATKMAQSPDQVIAFLRDFVAKARPMAERDLEELSVFAASELQIEEVQPWDVGYAAEKLREQKYALSEEELKPYFPLPAVMDGLFAVIERVLGV